MPNSTPFGTNWYHSPPFHTQTFGTISHNLALIHINWHHLAPFHIICYDSKKFSHIQWYFVPVCSIKMAKFNFAAICTIWHLRTQFNIIHYHLVLFITIWYILCHSVSFRNNCYHLLPFVNNLLPCVTICYHLLPFVAIHTILCHFLPFITIGYHALPSSTLWYLLVWFGFIWYH